MMGQTMGLPDVRRYSTIQGAGTSPRQNSLDSNILNKYAAANGFQFNSGANLLKPEQQASQELKHNSASFQRELVESFERDSEDPSESENPSASLIRENLKLGSALRL